MSIWYHLNVTCIARDKAAVAKFFGLRDSWEDVRNDMFEFSFGGKNGPGLRLSSIIEKNPDLIFFVEQQIECDTVQHFLIRAGKEPEKQQFIFVQDSGPWNNSINKKLLELYEKEMPGLAAKHFKHEKGFENFRWTSILSNFEKTAAILDQAEEYKEMSDVALETDMDFDNQPLEDL